MQIDATSAHQARRAGGAAFYTTITIKLHPSFPSPLPHQASPSSDASKITASTNGEGPVAWLNPHCVSLPRQIPSRTAPEPVNITHTALDSFQLIPLPETAIIFLRGTFNAIMPSHMHPRSRWTLSLFTTTLMMSFLIVGMPHILPCPVPPRAFAEGTENGQRRRRQKADGQEESEEESTARLNQQLRRRERECPVPKPGGLVGQIMGFEAKNAERPIVKVEPLRRRKQDSDD